MRFLKCVLFVLSSSLLAVSAGEDIELLDFLQIDRIVRKTIQKLNASEVLIVLDIDNTILTMPQELGSDQWWNWQYSECIRKQAKMNFCVSNDLNELMEALGQIYALANPVLTDNKLKSIVKNWQSDGYKLIALTSRRPILRNVTEKALLGNGIQLGLSAIGKNGFAGSYLPYNTHTPEQFGLTQQDLKHLKNNQPRMVSYMDGLFLTAGQDKGIMLKTLLSKTKAKIKSIIFVDDHKKHTMGMRSSFSQSTKVDLTTIRFSKMDKQVEHFQKSDKLEVSKQWQQFRDMRDRIFRSL